MQVTIPVRVTADLNPSIAHVMAESVRRAMPDARLVHVAETGTQKLDGFDEIMHVDVDGDYVDQLLRIMASLEGNVLSLDYDVIVNRDVSVVFEQDFDVAMTARPVDDKTIHPRLRSTYNMGVVFSKNAGFWRLVRSLYQTLPDRDGWMNSQTLASQTIRLMNGRYKVIELPGDEYNYTPSTEAEDVSKRKIVHYKGARKGWMLPMHRRSEVNRNVQKTLRMVTHGVK